MKLAYRDMEHVLHFEPGYVHELIIENRKMFFDMVNSIALQADGQPGGFVLSISDKPVEFSRFTDLTVQFAPFQVNRKNLLTKLYAALEKNALSPENYMRTGELLGELEKYTLLLADELPFGISCQKLAIGPILRALSPEIEEWDKSPLERIFSYMELVRELDRDKLFIMINMRTYFPDEDMERFAESACLHDFKVLLVESAALKKLEHTRRVVIDADLCEF